MSTILTLICYFLFGTIVVVGVGIFIQLRQQKQAKKDQQKPGDNPGSSYH